MKKQLIVIFYKIFYILEDICSVFVSDPEFKEWRNNQRTRKIRELGDSK